MSALVQRDQLVCTVVSPVQRNPCRIMRAQVMNVGCASMSALVDMNSLRANKEQLDANDGGF